MRSDDVTWVRCPSCGKVHVAAGSFHWPKVECPCGFVWSVLGKVE